LNQLSINILSCSIGVAQSFDQTFNQRERFAEIIGDYPLSSTPGMGGRHFLLSLG
jgi:hypothetical protein